MKCPLRKNEMETVSFKGNECDETQNSVSAKVLDFADCYEEKCMAYKNHKCMILDNDPLTVDQDD
jgi:hypothetical protein